MPPSALPEELLQQILLQLHILPGHEHDKENRSRVKTLRACSRVSRAFARSAAIALYHTLDVRFTDHQRFVPLVLQLVQRPSLARHVKRLSVRDLPHPDDECDNLEACFQSKSLSLESMVAAAKDAAGLTSETAKDLVDTLSSSHCSACIAVLLALCPHLEHLDFNIPYPIRTTAPVVAALLRKLTRLREIEVGQSNLSKLSTGEIEPLLGIPSLKTLRVNELAWEEDSPISVDHVSQLEHLYLTYTTVSAEGLVGILKTLPVLRTLDIEWYPGGEYPGVIPLQHLGLALQKHGAQLYNLRMDTNLRNSEGCRLSTQIASLATLDNLRYLSLPSEALISDDADDPNAAQPGSPQQWRPLTAILPRSLKLLRIYDEWNTWGETLRVDEQLELLMADPQFTQLRGIRVRRRFGFTGEADALGWSEVAIDNQYWMMLKRTAVR